MDNRRFNQGELNKVFAHISPRTLLSWAKLGILPWADEVVNGRGKIRLYDMENLYQVGLIEELSSVNAPLELIKVVLSKLLEEKRISENIDSCVVIYKTKPGYIGWDIVPPVARYKIDEMWQLLKTVFMAPIWEYPAAIVVSLQCVVNRVNKLVEAI